MKLNLHLIMLNLFPFLGRIVFLFFSILKLTIIEVEIKIVMHPGV